MLFCDRCSLILCQDQVPQVGRKLEINKTIDNKTYFISSNDDGTLTISPWPFAKNAFELDLEYRILTEASFNGNQALKGAIEEADVAIRTFTITKSK